VGHVHPTEDCAGPDTGAGFVVVTRHAFVYGVLGQTVIDLNTLVDPPGVVLDRAVAIKDRGQILANSANGRAYLLTPVPEPGSWAMLVCGLALVLKKVARPRPDGALPRGYGALILWRGSCAGSTSTVRR